MGKIRLWKLGNAEKGIYPTDQIMDSLCNILANAKKHEGDEPLDIIWGPDISVEVVEGDMDVIYQQLADGSQKITVVDNG